jgi:hypothetical protein
MRCSSKTLWIIAVLLLSFSLWGLMGAARVDAGITPTPTPMSTDTPMPLPTDTPIPTPTDTPMPTPTAVDTPTLTPTDPPATFARAYGDTHASSPDTGNRQHDASCTTGTRVGRFAGARVSPCVFSPSAGAFIARGKRCVWSQPDFIALNVEK